MKKMYKHEDERRILTEVIKDEEFRSLKVIVAKDKCNIGGHYHKDKKETFYLVKGRGSHKLGILTSLFNEGDFIEVEPGLRHEFWLEEGSILIGTASKPFDANDEHTT